VFGGAHTDLGGDAVQNVDSSPEGSAPEGSVRAAAAGAMLESALFEVKKVVVGQDAMVERMLLALVARGHCLLEGVPGVAKTLAVTTLASVVGVSSARIQFTPDLLPSDITGTRVWRAGREEFDTELGPVFANLVLADEINRAPAKVQSALLEVMAEKQVSIGRTTHLVPLPFLVFATQNPIESEGVYALPEAQRDRFLLKVDVAHPSLAEEVEIARRMGVRPPQVSAVLDVEDVLELQAAGDEVFVHHSLFEYAARLVTATREPARYGAEDLVGVLAHGASPRGTLGLLASARAHALLHGRGYVVPEDVAVMAPDVLAHRLVLSVDALIDGVDPRAVVARVLAAVVAPRLSPERVDAA
jgi:MoxR-like ATPase